MAVESAAPQTDKDLASIAEARALARAARQAQARLAELSQEQIDAVVTAMAEAVTPQAEALARLAVEETGYGVIADKVQKNLFASRRVYDFIRPMRTVGVINRIEDRKIIEIAEPFGVVAAVVPSTNPTSTAIYKVLIALKARCAIVISPHPAAVRCITRAVEIMAEAAADAGAPPGSIGWMKTVTLEGTQELMKHRDVAVILATGGMGLVRAAYSAGKPAYGVGPGNAPAYIERSADIKKAVRDIITGKTFDNGVLCSSENSVVVDEAIAEEARREFVAQHGYFMNPAEIDAVAKVFVTAAAASEPGACREAGGAHRTNRRDQGTGRHPGPHGAARGCWPRLSPFDRKARPDSLLVRRQRLAAGMRTLYRDSALRRHGAHDVDPLQQRRGGSPVRTEETGVPHLRQHPDDAWVNRADNRAGSCHDAGVWRLGRQHHVRQHNPASSAQRETARVRGTSGRCSWINGAGAPDAHHA